MNNNILKGILIVFVIIDHNEYVHQQFRSIMLGLSFHVVGFLTLPFFRPAEPLVKQSFYRLLLNYYYPFSWIVLSLGIYELLMSKEAPVSQSIIVILQALYSGSNLALEKATGTSMFWFLPSLISIIIIRNIFYYIKGKSASIFLVFLFIAHVSIGVLDPTNFVYVPLGFMPALYVAFLAIFISQVQKQILAQRNAIMTTLGIAALFFVVKYTQTSVGLYQEIGFMQVGHYLDYTRLIINDLEAITGTLLIFQLARLPSLKLFERYGSCSMYIYLFHAFIAVATFHLLERFMPLQYIVVKLAFSVVVTVILAHAFSVTVLRFSILKTLLFPKYNDNGLGTLNLGAMTDNNLASK